MRKRKKFLRIGLLLLLIGYVSAMLINQQMQFNYVRSQKQQISEQIAKLKEENQRLERQIDLSNTDEYVEKVAREQLGMVKDGEVRYLDDSELGK
ncbi:septum formation initiator family protein [Mahella sp.]|uniref:FtsB family cell division protein n=1 Tax=Mahella sp. TaxID=2798721 RepID=UPI0025C42169|nr:septum formation initiator family protein [Mahella sp.]MBZ4666548.1 Septum formation initiator [Mahella sp.]